MSILSKVTNKQINKKRAPYIKALEKVHQQMLLETSGYQQDQQLAQRLTYFINKVLWPRKAGDIVGVEDIIPSLLNDEVANQIRSTLGIDSKITRKMNWKGLEDNINNIIHTLLEYGNISIQEQFGGTSKSTVPLLDNIPQKYQTAVLKAIANMNWAKNTVDGLKVLVHKDQKADALFITGQVQDSDYQLLSNLSFSIKNYGGELRLEEVNEQKAYLALINFMKYKNMSPRAIGSLYGYFQDQNKPPEVYEHLEHIRNIFALTGMGTQIINLDELSLSYQIFARFLLYRPGGYGSSGIVVLSTKALIYDMLNSKNHGFKLLNGITKLQVD